jgi:hypothetical protein
MSYEYIKVPAEDLESHIRDGISESVRSIAKRIAEHLEAASDTDLTLDEAVSAINENGWTLSDLELEPDVDDVAQLISDHGWSRSDLGLPDTVSEAIEESGHGHVLRQISEVTSDNPWLMILTDAFHAADLETRIEFLKQMNGAFPTTFATAIPLVVQPVDAAAVKREAVAELTAKLATLLAS